MKELVDSLISQRTHFSTELEYQKYCCGIITTMFVNTYKVDLSNNNMFNTISKAFNYLLVTRWKWMWVLYDDFYNVVADVINDLLANDETLSLDLAYNIASYCGCYELVCLSDIMTLNE
jgi:hypothetical protein